MHAHTLTCTEIAKERVKQGSLFTAHAHAHTRQHAWYSGLAKLCESLLADIQQASCPLSGAPAWLEPIILLPAHGSRLVRVLCLIKQLGRVKPDLYFVGAAVQCTKLQIYNLTRSR